LDFLLGGEMNATGLYGNTTETPHYKDENDEENGPDLHNAASFLVLNFHHCR
jgi:hypothetical protein